MAINAKRLLKLADYLETVPPRQFDMTNWGRETECGFAGCAIGWAVHGNLFPGLALRPLRHPVLQKYEPYYRQRGSSRGRTGFAGITNCFSLPPNAAFGLFTEDASDETPKQVAKRIRKFVRDNQAPPLPGGA